MNLPEPVERAAGLLGYVLVLGGLLFLLWLLLVSGKVYQ